MRLKNILLLLLLLLVQDLSFADGYDRSITYTVKDGLNRNIVTCFIQDQYGYGWVGTSNGVSRFDGYFFKHYPKLENSNINSMVIDKENRLWVSANYGLFLYNYTSDSFELIYKGYTHELSIHNNELYFLIAKNIYKLKDKKPVQISDKEATSFLVTDAGIWYSYKKSGLIILDNNNTKTVINKNHFKVIAKVEDRIFSASFNGELYVISKGEKPYKIDINNTSEINDIKLIGEDIWIATNGNGIIVLDENLKVKNHIYADINKKSLIRSNSINRIYSIDNLVWISSHGGGITCLLPNSSTFYDIFSNKISENSTIENQGFGLYIEDEICILGTNYGLYNWNLTDDSFTTFESDKFLKELDGIKIRCIEKNFEGNYLIATYDGVLGKYTNDLELIKTYNPFSAENLNDERQDQKIIQVFNIDNKKFLISSMMAGGKLILFDTDKDTYIPINLNNKTGLQTISIRRNNYGEIILLQNRFGLFKYSEKSNSVITIFENPDDIFKTVINDFHQDEEGNYYLATKRFGLVKVNNKGKIIKKWTIEDGLKTNTLLRIETYKDNELWISSIFGLVRLDLSTDKLQLFDNNSGLSSNEFSPHSSSKFNDNKIVFGNSNGFTIIDPSKVIIDTCNVEVIISDIKFQNTSIKTLIDEKYLSRPIEETSQIILPIDRNSFTIVFFTKDNNFPKQNNFSYKLDGLQDNWIYLGEDNHITYTNLSPGTYTFRVKSTNMSNVWSNSPTLLTITILPPWHLTWWAYSIYIIISILIIVFSFKFYKRRLKLKLDLDMANFAVEKEHELTEKKMTFFTSISHDLKTIATLISAPVNDILSMKDLDNDKIKKLNIIKRNAEMLYKLNVELLEFRKISKNKLSLKVQKVDVISIIKNVFENFSQECESKNINYTLDLDLYNSPAEGTFIDVKKIERIFLNLLSNAIKYTDEGGDVSIKIVSSEIGGKDAIDITVSDTGVGFDTSETDKIFDRFYQVDNNSKEYGGVGIGLFIVKELISLHRGVITVKSDIGVGSVFTAKIPIGKANYSDSEVSNKEWVDKSNTEIIKDKISDIAKETSIDVPKRKYNQYSIVIVEDNDDLRSYLKDHFSINNTVYDAENGKKGLELIIDKNPDIIISDVDMPIMNGYEMCDSVKSNFNTSHIPFILLTGNTELEDKLKGMYSGADNYITKPFEVSYIDAVVDSLLHNRHKLREKFMGIEPVSSDEKMSSHDIDFINKFKELIIENISNPDLNIDVLVTHFAVSRSQLNRKVKDLVGTTPSNYIKTIRLKQAYELLMIKNSRVSDVAYQTGFSDPNYFTLCFKKEFGKNPSKV